jgi:CubicO group peptidase (beta-lactamase class C family)
VIPPVVLFLILLLVPAGPGAPPQDTRFSPEAVRAAAAGMPRLRSLLVSRHGKLVFEYYARGAGPARATNVKSVSKSVISALVGVAIDRRILPGVNEPIARYFPELTKDPDARKARITVEDLLTMRSGLESTSFDNYGSWVRSRNWVRYVLDQPMVSDPGTTMEYSTGSTHLLSAILTRAAKVSTWAFLQESLGKPLGVTFSRWPRDPQGIYFGGNDMLMTPRQMVAFGELYLNRGRAGDRQIVPAAWVETSCTPRGRSRFNPDQTYGYGWWMRDFAGRQGCFAWGYGGQYIMTFRDLGLVVVTTSSTAAGDERRDYRRGLFDLVERHILGPRIDAEHTDAHGWFPCGESHRDACGVPSSRAGHGLTRIHTDGHGCSRVGSRTATPAASRRRGRPRIDAEHTDGHGCSRVGSRTATPAASRRRGPATD